MNRQGQLPIIRFLPTLLFLLLAILFYFPVFLGKTQLHGDGIVHGYAFFDYLRNIIFGDESLLWTDNMYGGHPIFAESQGGFVNPFNILIALLFPSSIGHNIFHLVCIWGGASGVYCWLRQLKMTQISSVVGALALSFSGSWLSAQQNLSISSALLWLPWLFYTYEIFISKPSVFSASLLALPATCMLTAGYPQVLHAAGIYIVTNFIIRVVIKSEYAPILFKLGWYFLYGAIAVLLFFCLSAIQLFPLLELTTYSHRAEGVAIWNIEPSSIFRGLLFHPLSSFTGHFPFEGSVGSAFVCTLALIALLLKRKKFLLSHAIPVILLIALSFGRGPVYELSLEYSLIPGLGFFRTTSLYALVAVIGVSLLAAYAVDNVNELIKTCRDKPYMSCIFGAVIVLTLTAVLLRLGPYDAIPKIVLLTPLLLLLSAFALVVLNLECKMRWLILIILVMEILLARIAMFGFYDRDLLKPPKSLTKLEETKDLRQYKLFDNTALMTYSFKPSKSPDLVHAMLSMKDGISPSTNLLWDLPSLQGATALPLGRRMLIERHLYNEINGLAKGVVGARLIDLLGVRFITSIDDLADHGFREYYHSDYDFFIYENVYALPKFRAYASAEIVADENEAFEFIKTLRQETLVVEGSEITVQADEYPSIDDDSGMSFSVIHDGTDQYVVETYFTKRSWLYISDMNYPGWKAYVDGIEAKVHSANILGKAVIVEPGKHRVVFRFESESFKVGLYLSLMAALFVLFVCIYKLVYRFSLSRKNCT